MIQGAAGGNGRGRRGGRPTKRELQHRKKEEEKAAARQAYAENMREAVRRYLAGETSPEQFDVLYICGIHK